MKTSLKLILIACSYVFYFVGNLFAQHLDYLPLTKAERGKPFPIRYLATFDTSKLNELPKQFPIGMNGAEFNFDTESELGITLSGKDKFGKPWVVYIGNKGGLGGDFFAADLDKNRIGDFIFLFYTGGNGLAPTAHIYTLLFDATGRPVPFEAEGYFDWEKKTLADLVDMNGDGKAELVFMNFDDGYWITNIYKASGARWQRVNGKFGKHSFPLYTRFTNRPNHAAVKPQPGRHPFAPDLANHTPFTTGRMTGFTWAKDASDEEEFSCTIQETSGKEITCTPDRWYGSAQLVMDSTEGRKILALWSDKETVKTWLEEIIKQRYTVSLFGKRFADNLSPELIWVSK
ncbi:MAG: hypothetical protein AB1757_10010 [Acidobacteriota bacterium]